MYLISIQAMTMIYKMQLPEVHILTLIQNKNYDNNISVENIQHSNIQHSCWLCFNKVNLDMRRYF